jgi:hypothetical protein
MTKAVNPVIMKTEGAKEHAKVLKISATSSKLTYFLVSFLALPAIVTMPVLLKYWLTPPRYHQKIHHSPI